MLFLAFCVCLFCAIGNIVFPIEQSPSGKDAQLAERHTFVCYRYYEYCIYSCMMLLQKKHDKIELTNTRILFIIKTK